MYIEESKKKNLFTILVFMDIKGAFDDTWWPAIIKQLKYVRASPILDAKFYNA